jgi:hypothetical protein
MSNLSELIPAGGAGKNVSFVASGTLPNGQAVVLKADGTVEAVASSGVAANAPSGSLTTFEAARSSFVQMAFDPNNGSKFVLCYVDNGNGEYATAIIGTVSGDTISFGTPAIFQSSAGSVYIHVAYDTTNKFVAVCVAQHGGYYGETTVGTVSGTSISFGTSVVYESATNIYARVAFTATPNVFVIAYYNATGTVGKAMVGTVSGTSMSYGSILTFQSNTVGHISLSADPNDTNKLVLSYFDQTAASGKVVILTRSSTTLTAGTAVTFDSTGQYFGNIEYDPITANRFLLVWSHGAASMVKAVVGSVSGTTISLGTILDVHAAHTTGIDVAFDPNNANLAVISYYNSGAGNPLMLTQLTLSGTTLTTLTPVVVKSTNTTYSVVGYTSTQSGKIVQAFSDENNSRYGTAIVSQASTFSTNVADFIGMADAAIADTAAGSVTIKGGLAKSISNVAIDVPGTVPDGNAVYFSTGRGRYSNVQWDPSDSTKFVVAWTDGSTTPTYQGYAAVGSVSGNTITYGTPVQFDSLSVSDMDTNSIAFDPNQSGRFVIFYSGGGGQGSRAIAGTRSGTNLSFGTSVQVFNNPAVQPSIEFDPNTSGQFLMNWGDGANNLRVGTLSGTTITLGTLVSISASYNQPNLVADPNNAGKYLIVYQDGADSDHGYVAVVTVTGTTPSMATPVKFLSAACVQPKIVYDSGVADAFVMVFVDGGNSSQARAIAGVVSGTTVSFGTAITFNSNANNQLTTIISADPNKTGSFIAVADVNTIGEATFLTRSGTNTITAEATHTLYNAAKLKGAIAFNPSASKSGQFVYVTEDRSASPYKSISVLGQGGYTTSVIVPGTDYYVQADGTISTTSTSPAVKLGKALSTTSINLEFNT